MDIARVAMAFFGGSSASTFLSSSFPSSCPVVLTKRTLAAAKARANADEDTQQAPAAIDDSDFESRLAKIQRKVTSGSGKKAEKRKARKEGRALSSANLKGSILLPPAPLKDPVSGGLKVELGFNSYSERLNGRFAALGLAAVLLVELATGTSFLKYHTAATIGIQIYFVLAVSALYIKYEKEKISIWPKN